MGVTNMNMKTWKIDSFFQVMKTTLEKRVNQIENDSFIRDVIFLYLIIL